MLLVNALKSAGLTEGDVTIVNVPIDQTPQALAQGQVDAIGAWQPIAGETLRKVAGSHAIYSSAHEPGLIYDGLAVTPRSLAEHRADWIKLVAVWDKIVRYLRDPDTKADAIAIMVKRSGLAPAEYQESLAGTRFLTLADGQKKRAASSSAGFNSLKVSFLSANDFNLKHGIYQNSQNPGDYIDVKIEEEALADSAK